MTMGKTERGPWRNALRFSALHANYETNFWFRTSEGQSLEPGADGIPAHPALAGESGEMPTPP
jgi:hypothetical protein